MKLSTKLTSTFSTILAIIISILLTIIYFQTEKILKRERIFLMESRVLDIMNQVDRFLAESLHDVKIMTGDPVISSETATTEEILERLVFYRNTCKKYVSLSFFNLEKIRIADTSGLSIGKPAQMSRFWTNLLNEKISIAKDVHIEEPFRSPIIYLGSVVTNKEGKEIGVIVARIMINRLFDVIKEANGEKIDIFNNEGFLIYSNYNKKGTLKDTLFEQKSIGNLSQPIGSSIHKHSDGERMVQSYSKEFGYSDFKGNGWIAFSYMPTKILFAPIYKLSKTILIIFLAMLPLAIFSLYLFSIKITRPLLLLKNASEELAKGKLDVQVEINSKDEIGFLCTAFNSMAKDLSVAMQKEKEFTSSLEEKVLERTEKLQKMQKGTLNILEDLKESMLLLKKSKQDFINIVEKSSDGILVVDLNGIILYANPAATFIFKIKKEAFLGKAFGIPIIKEKITEIDIIRKNEETGIGEMLSGPTKWGQSDALLIFIRDITERKKAEETLKKILKIKTTFTSMVSHELRTPLASIKEGISVVLDKIVGSINQEQQQYLEIAIRNVDRLSRLINSVLDFQALESGKMKLRMEKNDINEVAKEVWQTMSPSAKKKNLSLVCQLDETLPKVNFDRDKITEVLTNIVHNAIKFTEKGGITISLSKEDNFIQVKVEDTGIGIKEEDIKTIFQEFMQISRNTGGTGLGLSICKKTIELHKGKIWVESKFSKGSAFYFTLPI